MNLEVVFSIGIFHCTFNRNCYKMFVTSRLFCKLLSFHWVPISVQIEISFFKFLCSQSILSVIKYPNFSCTKPDCVIIYAEKSSLWLFPLIMSQGIDTYAQHATLERKMKLRVFYKPRSDRFVETRLLRLISIHPCACKGVFRSDLLRLLKVLSMATLALLFSGRTFRNWTADDERKRDFETMQGSISKTTWDQYNEDTGWCRTKDWGVHCGTKPIDRQYVLERMWAEVVQVVQLCLIVVRYAMQMPTADGLTI